MPSLIFWSTPLVPQLVAVVFAWYLQMVISAFYSALRGGKIFATALFELADERGWLAQLPCYSAERPFDPNESLIDEAIEYTVYAPRAPDAPPSPPSPLLSALAPSHAGHLIAPLPLRPASRDSLEVTHPIYVAVLCAAAPQGAFCGRSLQGFSYHFRSTSSSYRSPSSSGSCAGTYQWVQPPLLEASPPRAGRRKAV